MTSDACPIARINHPEGDVLPFPTWRMLQALRADGAMEQTPEAPQCSMTALLDCRATVEAIFNDNVAFLDNHRVHLPEWDRRCQDNEIVSGMLSILDKIINAKRIGP